MTSDGGLLWLALADAAEGFSGAEIEAAVKAALLDALMDGAREVTTADLLRRAWHQR